MGFAGPVFLSLSLVYILAGTPANAFNCTGPRTTCRALIDYLPRNDTTLSAIRTLFNVTHLRSLLGANNLPLSTPPTLNVSAQRPIKIPFHCLCANGTGVSNRSPIYTVVANDFLDHIARDIFSALVTYQQIQSVNGLPNPNQIDPGQRLWIPLPCSCDEVEGRSVVHYGHMVASGSTVEGIAQQYNTSADTLLRLNGLASPNDLQADTVLDVPLAACNSMVRNNSADYPFLVPNGTYAFTATNCVMCTCDAANNWTLRCEPSQINSSAWRSCPAATCQGTESLVLGNTTSTSCGRTTCAYAGYGTNRTIFTTLAVESTCPATGNSASKFNFQGWSWNTLLTSVHLVLLCLYYLC